MRNDLIVLCVVVLSIGIDLFLRLVLVLCDQKIYWDSINGGMIHGADGARKFRKILATFEEEVMPHVYLLLFGLGTLWLVFSNIYA